MNRQTRHGHDDSFVDAWAAFARHDLDRTAPPQLERRILATLRARRPALPARSYWPRTWLLTFSLGTAAGLVLAAMSGLLRTAPPGAGDGVTPTDRTVSMPVPSAGALATVQPVDPLDSGMPDSDGPDVVNAATPLVAAPLVTLAIDDVASAESLHLVRVRMPRAALGTLGLALYDPEATGMVDVDIVVGDDGLPRDIRTIRPVTADTIEE